MATAHRSVSSIEDIIMSQDSSDISVLRPHLSHHYCMDAARFMHDKPGTAFIVTGFYEEVPTPSRRTGPLAVGRA